MYLGMLLFGLAVLAAAKESPVHVDETPKPTFWLTVADDGKPMMVKAVYGTDGKLSQCEAAAVKTTPEEPDQSGSENDALEETMVKEREERACRQFERQHATVQNANEAQETVQHEKQLSRAKRSFLIWPGTNWCGKGSKAEFSDSFGEQKEADQCCQRHDQCPYLIEGFSTRFHLTNYRMHTLSHCDCDMQFMNCLKSANTSTATTVAKVYFNVVNTECFDLKLKKVCIRRKWYGSCEKYTTKYSASVRSLGNFPE